MLSPLSLYLNTGRIDEWKLAHSFGIARSEEESLRKFPPKDKNGRVYIEESYAKAITNVKGYTTDKRGNIIHVDNLTLSIEHFGIINV